MTRQSTCFLMTLLLVATLAACGSTRTAQSPTAPAATEAPTRTPRPTSTLQPASEPSPEPASPTPQPTDAPTAQPEAARPGTLYVLANTQASTGGSATQLVAVAPETGETRPLTGQNDKVIEYAFSADGAKVALTIASADYGTGGWNIFTMNTDGSDIIQHTNDSSYNNSPVWSPNNERLVFLSDREAERECEQICYYDLYMLEGEQVKRLTATPDSEGEPAWSPDGTRIAFTRGCDVPTQEECRMDVYVMNADGSSEVRLTDGRGVYKHPQWSADGNQISFEMTREGRFTRYTISSDGGQPTTQFERATVGDTTRDYSFTPSPDGSLIAFVRQSGECQVEECVRDIMIVGSDGSNERQLSQNLGWSENPTWSPDGTHIAFTANRGERNGLYIADVRGSEPKQIMASDEYTCCLRWFPHR